MLQLNSSPKLIRFIDIKPINLLQKNIINLKWTHKIFQSKQYQLIKLASLLPTSRLPHQNLRIKETTSPSSASLIFLAPWIVKLLKVNQLNLMDSADWILSNTLSIPSFIPYKQTISWVSSLLAIKQEWICNLLKWTKKENKKLLKWYQIWKLKELQTYGMVLNLDLF